MTGAAEEQEVIGATAVHVSALAFVHATQAPAFK